MKNVEANCQGCVSFTDARHRSDRERPARRPLSLPLVPPGRHGEHYHRAALRSIVPWAVLFATLFAVPAIAQTPNQAAEKEARSYLEPCDEEYPSDQVLCEKHQSTFIYRFVTARSGDIESMIAVAMAFDGPLDASAEGRAIWKGMPYHNATETCAWRLFIHTKLPLLSEPYEQARKALFELSPSDQPHCLARAETIERDIRTHPARRPADNWHPVADKIKPSDKIDRRCLINTVPSENTADDPPPPPGCPR